MYFCVTKIIFEFKNFIFSYFVVIEFFEFVKLQKYNNYFDKNHKRRFWSFIVYSIFIILKLI